MLTFSAEVKLRCLITTERISYFSTLLQFERTPINNNYILVVIQFLFYFVFIHLEANFVHYDYCGTN